MFITAFPTVLRLNLHEPVTLYSLLFVLSFIFSSIVILCFIIAKWICKLKENIGDKK